MSAKMNETNNLPEGNLKINRSQVKACKDAQLPELLKLKCDQRVPNQQYIDCRFVDPVVINENRARFVLPKIGWLNNNSKLIVGLKWSGNGTDRFFLPSNIGIDSIIKDVVFRASGKELSRINFYDHYRSFESVFYQGENIKNIGTVKHGITGAWRNGVDSTNAGGSDLKFQQNTLEYDTQYETDIVSATKKLLYNNSLILENGKEFQIDLGALVPVIANAPLPLYDINDQLELEIEFNKNIYITGEGQTDITKTLTVDPNTTGLLCDFILYDGEVMEKLRRNQWSLPLAREYNLYMRTLIPSNNRISETLNLGGANRFVEGLIIMLTDQGLNDTQRYNSTLSYYRSVGAKLTNDTRIQLKLNGVEVFPQTLKNPSQLASHLNNYNSFRPYINREEYFDEGPLLMSDIVHEKHDIGNVTSGNSNNKNFFYFKINRPVNKEGLILQFDRNTTAVQTTNLLMRAYVVVNKTINCVNKRMYQSYM
eukprot:COSAG06_NODE_480_length_15163_cov_50.478757_3_plen_482_part_00